MRLLLRLAGGTGAPLDLHLELADDVTVGELADHLSSAVASTAADGGGRPGGASPTLSVRTGREDRLLARDALVRDAGPPSGSTVRLLGEDPELQADAESSPVRLVPPGGEPVTLVYGTSSVCGARFNVGDRAEVSSTDLVSPTVDGEPVMGTVRLRDGDLLGIGEQTFGVRITAALRPPVPHGPTVPVRRHPAHRRIRAPQTVELPVPPGPARIPGFPLLSATVPLLMGAGLWAVTRSAASAIFVVFSFVFVVASGLEARRESRAEARFREEEFRADLAEREQVVEQLRRRERRHAERRNPPIVELVDVALRRGTRLWERVSGPDADERSDPGAERAEHGPGDEPATGGSADLLSVRLGVAPQVAGDRISLPTTGRRDLLSELRRFAECREHDELPVTVDLQSSAGLAVVGPGEAPTAVARAVLVQLAVLVGPDELGVEVVTSDERAPRWRWCDWLPHRHAGDRPRHRVVVVDGGDPAAVEAIARGGSRPARVLWLAADTAGLPAGLGAVLRLGEGPGSARLLELGADGAVVAEVDGVAVEDLSDDDACGVARSLASLEPAPTLQLRSSGHGSSVPLDACTLGGLLGGIPGSDDVQNRWERSAAEASLGAPLARVDRGVLRVDLRTDGPHALVAGTTGSGKSELLRTLLASLALHNAPDRLNLLLVDYKGGAAFGPLRRLPHTVGMITDLDPALAARALRSLRAEVRHREQVLADHGVSDLVELDRAATSRRPAALMVVVDEFAALARELPEFVDGLVDLAQRGRSLGIHLVLATQRPAGVVTDAIRANTALRVALRVADDDDSRDVVGDPGAARLPRDVPGRAVLRFGPGTRVTAQVAWTGATPTRDRRIQLRRLGAPAVDRDHGMAAGPAELDLLVDSAVRAGAASGLDPARRPWVDPLPEVVRFEELPTHATAERASTVAIGWSDRPEEQRRAPLLLDLSASGGALVVGAAGSGRSTTLATIAAALRIRHGDDVRLHRIGTVGPEPRMGIDDPFDDVVGADDPERVLRLLRATAAAVRERLVAVAGEARTRRVLMIDGYAAFEELHERVNRGEAVDLLGLLAREGRAAGVHVVVGATRRSEVPASLAAALTWRLHLRPASADDAAMEGLPAGAADPTVPAGRGHHRGEEVQVATPPAVDRLVRPVVPELVPRLPRQLGPDALRAAHPDVTGWRIAVGLEAERLGTCAIDLEHHDALVAGPPRSGVSTTLATIAAGAEVAHLLHGRTGATTGRWGRCVDWSEDSEGASELLAAAIRDAAAGRRTIVAVDDAHDLLDDPRLSLLQDELSDLVRAGRQADLRFVFGGEVDALGRCYSELLTRVRSGRTGVLLQPDRDLHAGLLHASLPARDDLPTCPGRGWVLAPGRAVAAQVAHA